MKKYSFFLAVITGIFSHMVGISLWKVAVLVFLAYLAGAWDNFDD